MGARLVVVVDDEERLCALVADALREHGFAVLTARDGRTAMALLASSPKPSLVLTDRAMPGMDGVALFDAIRAVPGLSDVPVAFFSATDDTGGRDVAIIVKPVR